MKTKGILVFSLLLVASVIYAQVDVIFQLDTRYEFEPENAEYGVYSPFHQDTFPLAETNGVWTTTVSTVRLDTFFFRFVKNGSSEILSNPEDCDYYASHQNETFRFFANIYQDTVIPLQHIGICDPIEEIVCSDPSPARFEDFESDPLGLFVNSERGWFTWDMTSDNSQKGEIVDFNGSRMLSFAHDASSGQNPDMIYDFGQLTGGRHYISFDLYVPQGKSAKYNLQHFSMPGQEWAYEVYFNSNGLGSLWAGDVDAAIFRYQQSERITILQVIDMENDWVQLYIDEERVFGWPFSYQSTIPIDGTPYLGAFNFFADEPDVEYYIDNLTHGVLTENRQLGATCFSAIPIDEGIQSARAINCVDDPMQPFTILGDAYDKALWYSYTPSADGVIQVGSCNDNLWDTRIWIVSGDCGLLEVNGVNDDMCGLDGYSYASYREVKVLAGTTYYIVWDNPWDNRIHDWSLDFVASTGEEGHFCETAIPIAPGIITIDALDGHAAIAGPAIGPYGGATTPYSNSKFYSFTAPFDGSIDITSCGLTDLNTIVWLYSSPCEALNYTTLLSRNDNGCANVNALQSTIENFAVEEGRTYLIEWSSEETQEGFDFELSYESNLVAIDFFINARRLLERGTLSADGLFLEYSTDNGFVLLPMEALDNAIYHVSLELRKNETFEYRYYNGTAEAEFVDKAPDCTTSIDGENLRTLVVPQTNTFVDTLCFNHCVNCDEVVNTKEWISQNIKVYPQVATTHIYVEASAKFSSTPIIYVVNALGQVLRQTSLSSNITTKIEVTNLPKGMYYLTTGDVEIGRFVKK